MPWERARFPRRPRGGSTVVTVDDAVVTAAERGPTAWATAPKQWVRGAVYTADGHLVPESQRLWAGDTHGPIATDPLRLRPLPEQPRELSGTWLFGGHFMPPFGHFVVETLSTLWPEAPDLTGLLFQHGYRAKRAPLPSRDAPLTAWHADLFALAGFGAQRKHEVLRQPLRVERLLVPTRPMVFKCWALPEATHVWQRVGEAAGAPDVHRRVFLSRAGFNRERRRTAPGEFTDRSDQHHDDRLDELMASAGFHVVEPQTLPVRDQVRLVRGADVVAAASGSALHLTAFARPGARVIELGDLRTATRPMPAQRVIDAVHGRTVAFVPYSDPDSTAREVDALLRSDRGSPLG